MTAGAFKLDDLPERARALLERSLWLSGQIPRLQQISEQLGVASHVTDIANCASTRQAQAIVEAGNRLNHDLSQYLAALQPERQAPVLRLKHYKEIEPS